MRRQKVHSNHVCIMKMTVLRRQVALQHLIPLNTNIEKLGQGIVFSDQRRYCLIAEVAHWTASIHQKNDIEELVRYLERKYEIDYVIGHHEYQNFQSTDLWKEADPDYRTVKTDPGDAFMNKLRKNLEDLNLKPVPTL